MRILHVVPGLAEKNNGIAVAARLIAKGQREAGHEVELVETREFVKGGSSFSTSSLHLLSEIWVHSNWWPPTLLACEKVLRAKVPLVRMTHANLDPLRYHSKFLKKLIFTPWERRLYRHTTRVVVTCEAERKWCEDWGVKGKIQVIDLKQFFTFDLKGCAAKRDEIDARTGGVPLKVLYLGREHPLKGTDALVRAVEEVNGLAAKYSLGKPIDLRLVHDHFDDALEADWKWCDVLCLPTLSENFGLVVAEALSRGIPVITTDGAPAWTDLDASFDDAVIWLKGYRDADLATRVSLLHQAFVHVIG